jgi:hypothetical protein
MKKFKTGIVTIAILLLTMGFATQDNWFLLKYDVFNIAFPKEPTSQPQVINSEIGELKINIFMYDASEAGNDENLVYLVSSTEYPDSLINSGKTEILPDLFKNTLQGILNNVNGKLLSENVIEINGFPGREVKVDFMEGQAIIKIRIFLVKNKLFMIETITETAKFPNKSIDRFMDSFKLTD